MVYACVLIILIPIFRKIDYWLSCSGISDSSISPLLLSASLRIAEDLSFLDKYFLFDGLLIHVLVKSSLLLNIQMGFNFIEVSILISSNLEVFN